MVRRPASRQGATSLSPGAACFSYWSYYPSSSSSLSCFYCLSPSSCLLFGFRCSGLSFWSGTPLCSPLAWAALGVCVAPASRSRPPVVACRSQTKNKKRQLHRNTCGAKYHTSWPGPCTYSTPLHRPECAGGPRTRVFPLALTSTDENRRRCIRMHGSTATPCRSQSATRLRASARRLGTTARARVQRANSARNGRKGLARAHWARGHRHTSGPKGRAQAGAGASAQRAQALMRAALVQMAPRRGRARLVQNAGNKAPQRLRNAPVALRRHWRMCGP